MLYRQNTGGNVGINVGIVSEMQKKKQRISFSVLRHGWGTWIRTKEMSDSESDALPLGYTPNVPIYNTLIGYFLQVFFHVKHLIFLRFRSDRFNRLKLMEIHVLFTLGCHNYR